MLRRLILVAVGAGILPKTQKCNIPRISGCAENISMVMGTLFDFHKGAGNHLNAKYPPGSTRFFLFGDLSKCFDRIQRTALIHALWVLLSKVGDVTRYLAAVDHLYESSSILVRSRTMATLIRKQAGVFQGGPDSGAFAGMILAYSMYLIPPQDRSVITLRVGMAAFDILAEFDYADDQIRVEDAHNSTIRAIRAIYRSHQIIGLDWNLNKVEILALRVSAVGKVEPFDPLIPLEIIGGPSGKFFKVIGAQQGDHCNTHANALGISFDYRGALAVDKMLNPTRDALHRVAHSHFPIPAKIDAIRTVTSRMLEYASSVVWIDQRDQSKLDAIERRSVRGFFKVHLPNAVTAVETKVGIHEWRSEVLFLSSFVRSVRAKDRRLRDVMLLMTRDQKPPAPVSAPLLSPRFFEWKGHQPPHIRNGTSQHLGILAYPTVVAMVAAKHKLGI